MATSPNLGKTRLFAEASSNHGQDLNRSLSLIRAAETAGFDGVKFQLFCVNELFAPEPIVSNLVSKPQLNDNYQQAWYLK